ncbi:aromatic compound dioxygenase [Xylariaceae sp. FL0016]|nr:aromatic compound dioxygenase [Xylariaceae sp. FL0016]
MVKFAPFIAGACLASCALAHPTTGGHSEEALARRAFLSSIDTRGLSSCADKMKTRGVSDSVHARRSAIVENLRRSNAQKKRDEATVLATSHLYNGSDITPSSTTDEVFSGTSTCILAPEVTEGPYLVTGEYVRQNLTEDQVGVPLYMDIQVIDSSTCEPMSDVAVDFWHANATGVYSGIIANANGNGESDPDNIDTTFLRGVQITDDVGAVQFQSIVPGHYTGRTNHIHIIAHTDYTVLANNTITNGTEAAHVGQFFFDQDLLNEVEATYPYTTNTQDWSQNSEDGLIMEETAVEGIDPVVEYIMIGDDISEGVFTWISVAINSTLNYEVGAASYIEADGGHQYIS